MKFPSPSCLWRLLEAVAHITVCVTHCCHHQGRVAMQDRSRPVSSSASVIGWETRPVLIFATGLGFATPPSSPCKWPAPPQAHQSNVTNKQTSNYIGDDDPWRHEEVPGHKPEIATVCTAMWGQLAKFSHIESAAFRYHRRRRSLVNNQLCANDHRLQKLSDFYIPNLNRVHDTYHSL